MDTVNGELSAEASSSASSYQALTMPLPPLSTANDNSEEWEYEYSTTETETYYLTLDLTNPSVPYVRPKVPPASRGGQKSIWVNPSLGRNKRQLGRAPTYTVQRGGKAPLSTSTPTPNPTPAPGPRRESMDPEQPEEEDGLQDAPEPLNFDAVGDMVDMEIESRDPEDKLDEIQILDLHSDNPLISWRGHNFSCNWAENLGTELLFAFRDRDDPLPILRALKDDVDLLAASSARLISTSVTLRPKKGFDSRVRGTLEGKPDESLKRKREGMMIRVGKEAKGPRREQANFLERLMEVKRMKGEEDEVTVTAQRRLYQSGWKMLVAEKREEKRRELRSALIGSGEEAQMALATLKEMDKEDKIMAAQERQKKERQVERKKSGRKSKEDGEDTPYRRPVVIRRPRGARASRESADRTLLNIPSGVVRNGPERVSSQNMLSMPTPQRWDDLGENSPLEQPDDDELFSNA